MTSWPSRTFLACAFFSRNFPNSVHQIDGGSTLHTVVDEIKGLGEGNQYPKIPALNDGVEVAVEGLTQNVFQLLGQTRLQRRVAVAVVSDTRLSEPTGPGPANAICDPTRAHS